MTSAPIRPPALAVTIDTEADDQWRHGGPLTTRNVAFWEPFQEVCEKHGAPPTYLVTTEIAEDARARDLLRGWVARGAAEVGAHLHAWSTPPFADRPGLRFNDPIHAFASQLPDDLLVEKTRTLTRQLTQAFGAPPTSFRSGRFGLDLRGARALVREGYLVDSSVTPGWSWRSHPGLGGAGGPDFSPHEPHAFLIGGVGDPGLMEIPVTIMPTYAAMRRWPQLLRAYQTLPVRAARRLLLSRWLLPQPLWLTPDPRYESQDLERLWECAAGAGLAATVMMFHSSELMPGGSPFRRDAAAVADLLHVVDRFLGSVRRAGGSFLTLTGMAARLSSEGCLPVRAL